MTPDVLRARLLAWYDDNARELPWRVGPADRRLGIRPDPYRVWLSEVMLQQTTVPHAAPYFLAFTARWPRVGDLAAAADEAVMAAWAGLGYYARARNLLACARTVAAAHGGRFPDTEAGLRTLPGFGPYTAAAVAAIAFDRPANVVDGNVERVMARLHAVETPLPAAKPELRAFAEALVHDDRPGDWAQALMDLGATVCRPKAPLCDRCPIVQACRARASGAPEAYPRKSPRSERPRRHGVAYLLTRGDEVALVAFLALPDLEEQDRQPDRPEYDEPEDHRDDFEGLPAHSSAPPPAAGASIAGHGGFLIGHRLLRPAQPHSGAPM